MTPQVGAASGTHGGAVLGGGVMRADSYAGFLGEEYLGSYLPAGGGSVKLVVAGDAEVADRFEASLREEADRRDVVMVSVSAESTKAHMVDQVLFAVSREVEWDRIAVALVHAAYDDIAVPATPGRLRVAEVAEDHDLDARELYRSVRRRLEQTLLSDSQLPRELRRALLRLAQARLGTGDVAPAEARVVLDWLHGERVALRELRATMIPSRIGRHNARTMLTSLGRLLLRAGRHGLVVHLDLTRLAVARRPPVAERAGLYYSTAAVLDAYELLRQLIDATDDLVGMLVVAVVPPELMRDERRGLPAYAALQLRVADEVRDRRRANPFASLARLEVRLEAVG
ncbi:MAG TPA: BREX system ATP-binding domain-containing protein [Nocardioidaceae bacterium]|nr:BREX system ATP-binding domain-containing protein [Nocardioidaceae bacterium]